MIMTVVMMISGDDDGGHDGGDHDGREVEHIDGFDASVIITHWSSLPPS